MDHESTKGGSHWTPQRALERHKIASRVRMKACKCGKGMTRLQGVSNLPNSCNQKSIQVSHNCKVWGKGPFSQKKTNLIAKKKKKNHTSSTNSQIRKWLNLDQISTINSRYKNLKIFNVKSHVKWDKKEKKNPWCSLLSLNFKVQN